MSNELDLAQSVFNGTLDLICPEMKLMVCPNFTEVALQGPGVIRSDKHGRLYFRMVAPFDVQDHPVLRPSRSRGELYQPTDHVILMATDENGRDWTSNRMIVDLSRQIPFPNWRVHKHLAHIMLSRQIPKLNASYSHVLIPGLTHLPFDSCTKTVQTAGTKEVGWEGSVDHHTSQIDRATVTFRKREGGWLSIFGKQTEAFMPYWADCMLHAMEFMAGGHAPAAVLLRSFNEREELKLCSGPFWRYDSAMPGPVHFQGPEGAGEFWKLLELFFMHLYKNWETVEPLLNELNGIRRGAQGSFQTACLTLAVGVESLARLLLTKDEPPTMCKRVFRDLLDHVSEWKGDQAILERAKGAISRLADVSAADRLYAWADRTGVDRSLVDRWKKLRPTIAHGNAVAEEQLGFDLYFSGVELMYRLVASAVGYEGPILPTSQRGWGVDEEGKFSAGAPESNGNETSMKPIKS